MGLISWRFDVRSKTLPDAEISVLLFALMRKGDIVGRVFDVVGASAAIGVQ